MIQRFGGLILPNAFFPSMDRSLRLSAGVAQCPATLRSLGPCEMLRRCRWRQRPSGYDWPDAWDLPYACASCICGRDTFQFQAELFDLLLNELPLIPQHADQVPHLRRQVGLGVLQNVSGLCKR